MFHEPLANRMRDPAGSMFLGPDASPARSETLAASKPYLAFMLGNSAAMREVSEQIRRFATSDEPVLVTGEGGTGKESVARAIHELSHRAGEPFTVINCALVPANLIGPQLFGCESSNAAGLIVRKPGLIEHADAGTLFLDQIGDMPLDLQGQLLWCIEQGEIVRTSGHEPVKVKARIMAATNLRPHEAINAGRLREDLYHRLHASGLYIPSLRERPGDVEVLATFFLRQLAHDMHRDIRGFTPKAIAAMQAYPWPGNVRELIATIRHAVVLSQGPQIQAGDLRLEAMPAATPDASQITRPWPGSSAERELLLHTLRRFDFNITRSAHALKVSRVTLYRMLQRNHLALRQECIVQDVGPAFAVRSAV